MDLIYFAGGFINCYNHFVKAIWHFSVKLNISINYNPTILLLGMYNLEILLLKPVKIFMKAFFIIAKTKN